MAKMRMPASTNSDSNQESLRKKGGENTDLTGRRPEDYVLLKAPMPTPSTVITIQMMIQTNPSPIEM